MSEPTSQPIADLQVGGTIPTTKLYVKRPEDDEVFTLLSAGKYCNVLTSRQMGKSSLVNHAKARLVGRDVRVVTCDLSSLGGDQLADAVAWYRSLLRSLGMAMQASAKVKKWLSERPERETNGDLFRAFVDAFLLHPEQSTIVVFDEVDATRDLPFTDDLFLAMRFLHNARAEDARYDRVTFCLVGVLNPDDLIKSQTRTPYNIGITVRLGDFSRVRCDLSELEAYLDAHDVKGAQVLDEILAWTGGQPYLTIALCDQISRAKKDEVDAFVRAELEMPTAFKVHFDRIEQIVRERIATSSKAARRYRDMLKGKRVTGVPEKDEEALLLAGLAKRVAGGALALRNEIYRIRFGLRWVDAVLPAPAIPTWVRVALAVMSVSLVVGGYVAYEKVQEDRLAKEAAARKSQYSEALDEQLSKLGAAQEDAVAQLAWANASKNPLASSDDRLGKAAQAYWERRQTKLRDTAKGLLDAGCDEEGLVLLAYAGAEPGEDMKRLGHVRGTTWLGVEGSPSSDRTELERCRERRMRKVDRIEAADGGEGFVVSSDGELVVIHARQAAQVLSSSGETRRTMLGDTGVSIGVDGPAVIARKGEEKLELFRCSKSVLDLQARHEKKHSVGYVCNDGRYGSWTFADPRKWFDEAIKVRPPPSQGFGAVQIDWANGQRYLLRTGNEGGIDGRTMYRLPWASAFAGSDEWIFVGIEGMGTRPRLSLLEDTGTKLRLMRAWTFDDCAEENCLVRRVAVASSQRWAALVFGSTADVGRTWLALPADDELTSMPFSGDNPTLLAVGRWSDTSVVAVPMGGRLRFYVSTAVEQFVNDLWEDLQLRTSLTVTGSPPRIVRREDGSPKPRLTFDDLFPSKTER